MRNAEQTFSTKIIQLVRKVGLDCLESNNLVTVLLYALLFFQYLSSVFMFK